MDNAGFAVELTPEAEIDYLNQVIWLEQNRSSDLAYQFITDFRRLSKMISINPYQWQTVMIQDRRVHRAVVSTKYVVLYQVLSAEKVVNILRIRGAAEDWTNTPIAE